MSSPVFSFLCIIIAAVPTLALSQQAKKTGAVPEARQRIELEPILQILSDRGSDASAAHPIAKVSVPANTPCGTLSTDAQNAFYFAAAASRSSGAERAKYAKACADILAAWADTNKSFEDKNGWLCAAWNVGSMARSAYVLKALKCAEYSTVAPRFEKWAVLTVQTYILPIDDKRPIKGTEPELLNPWETRHVTNRTMVSLECVFHVARLVGNHRWYKSAVDRYEQWIKWKSFKAPNREPDEGNTYFVNAQGENTDHHRGDIWHRTAGLASCLQICAMIKSDTNKDLFHSESDILRKSLEFYAAIHITENSPPIPAWDIAAREFPDSELIQSMVVRQKGLEQHKDPDRFYHYSWGFSDLLYLKLK